jgi:hypothetical protein
VQAILAEDAEASAKAATPYLIEEGEAVAS